MSDPSEAGQCDGQGWAETRGVCSEGKGGRRAGELHPKASHFVPFILAGGPIQLCSSSLSVPLVIFLR